MKDEDCLQNPDKQAKVHDLEKYIGQMVYKLCDLTPEEIVIVEGEKVKLQSRFKDMEVTNGNCSEKSKRD